MHVKAKRIHTRLLGFIINGKLPQLSNVFEDGYRGHIRLKKCAVVCNKKIA